MALIIKARYEAADRIMRILEVRTVPAQQMKLQRPNLDTVQEYRIVVGVPAADYLLQTIAEGKARMS